MVWTGRLKHRPIAVPTTMAGILLVDVVNDGSPTWFWCSRDRLSHFYLIIDYLKHNEACSRSSMMSLSMFMDDGPPIRSMPQDNLLESLPASLDELNKLRMLWLEVSRCAATPGQTTGCKGVRSWKTAGTAGDWGMNHYHGKGDQPSTASMNRHGQ